MRYPIFKVHVDADLAIEEVKKVLNSGFLNEGEQVTEFSNHISSYLDHKKVIPLNSCTSALTLALKLSGVGKNDEVISTSMTCVASNTPVHNLGAKIVWADIDHKTGNIDPLEVERLISDKTRAVICVNWAGLPCDLKKLHKICRDKGVKLIQDAAHSFGAKLDGKHVCHYSDYTCYSTQAIKHITTGDGGFLIVNTSEEDFKRAKKLKWFGIDRDATKDEKGEWKGQRWESDITEAGYKFHMNNISAAIGISQIPHIDNIISGHIKNSQLYSKIFKKYENYGIFPLTYPAGALPTFWVYTVILDKKIDRDLVIKSLNELGINAGLVHIPNHNYTCFSESKTELPETEYFNNHQISLPCGWWLTESDIEHIAKKLIDQII